LKKYEEIMNNFQNSLNLIQELLIDKTNLRKIIYKTSKQLNVNKTKICSMMLESLNIVSPSSNYNNALLRHMYENFHNEKLKGFMGFIGEDLDEVLDWHYRNDKSIQVIYNMNSNSLKILFAPKEYSYLIRKNFDEIFPIEFKEQGRNKFINAIQACKSNVFNFDFLIRKKDSLYIDGIKLRCVLHPSSSMNEIFLCCDYIPINDNFIIFKESTDLNEKRKILYSFSKGIEDILFLGIENFIQVKEHKFEFYFDEIFIQNKTAYAGVKKTRLLYFLDYRFYNKKLQSYVKQLSDHSIQENNNLQFVKIDQYIRENKSINCMLNIFTEFEKKSFKYTVFNFKASTSKTENTMQEDDINGGEEGLNLNELLSYNTQQTSSSASSQGVIARNTSNMINKKAEEVVNSKRLKQFTFFTLLINLFLIIYGIVFIFISISQNNYLKQLLKISQKFDGVVTYFSHTTLNFYASLAVYGEESNSTVNYDSVFASSSMTANGTTISFVDYLKSELNLKVDVFTEKLEEISFLIFSSSDVDLQGILDLTIDFYLLNITGLDIYARPKVFTFKDSLKIYLNNLKTIIASSYMFYPAYIIEFHDGIINFDNVYMRNLKPEDQSIYQVIMNYKNYLDMFFQSREIIMNKYTEHLERINSTALYYFIILLSIHGLLLMICLLYILFFKGIVKEYTFRLRTILDEAQCKYLLEKFSILQDLNYFYKHKPTKLIMKLKKLKESCVNKKPKNKYEEDKMNSAFRNNVNRSDGLMLSQKMKINENNKHIRIEADEFLSPLRQKLLYIFGLFYLFCLVLYFFVDSVYQQLVLSSAFSKNNSDIDITVLNNIMLIQNEILINQTDISLAKEMYNNDSSIGYVRENIGKYYGLYEALGILTAQTHIFDPIWSDDQQLMNCTNIYTTLNDSIFYQIQGNYRPGELTNNMVLMCSFESVMKMEHVHFLVEEINYISRQILDRVDASGYNYLILKLISDDALYFRLYVITAMIYRPIRSYVSEILIAGIMDSAINAYLISSILYFISNLIADIVIIILVNKLIVNKLLEINGDLVNIITCLKE
jgi:hypothetical protein